METFCVLLGFCCFGILEFVWNKSRKFHAKFQVTISIRRYEDLCVLFKFCSMIFLATQILRFLFTNPKAAAHQMDISNGCRDIDMCLFCQDSTSIQMHLVAAFPVIFVVAVNLKELHIKFSHFLWSDIIFFQPFKYRYFKKNMYRNSFGK